MGNLVVKGRKSRGEVRFDNRYFELAEEFEENSSVEDDAKRITEFFKNLKFTVGTQTDDIADESNNVGQLVELESTPVYGPTIFFSPRTLTPHPLNPFLTLPETNYPQWDTPDATLDNSLTYISSSTLTEQKEQPLPARSSYYFPPPHQISRRFKRKRSMRSRHHSKHLVSSPGKLDVILEHPDEGMTASNQGYISSNLSPSSTKELDSSTSCYGSSKEDIVASHNSISFSERLV
ncbi:unnamed protein product [Auanema sp. JU1783]|nr:unnamed protein product [Auanema sp. JU1783]